jgi:hypothetical protein
MYMVESVKQQHVVVVVKKTNTEYRSQKSALNQKELPTIIRYSGRVGNS